MEQLFKNIIEDIFDFDELTLRIRDIIEEEIDYESIARHFINEYTKEIQEAITEVVEGIAEGQLPF